MNGAKKIRDLYPARFGEAGKLRAEANDLYTEYKNLLMNAVTIDGVDYPVETFIKDACIECGCVGYDKLTGKFSLVYGEGLNELGNPTRYTFVYRNGKAYNREAYYDDAADGCYRIMALPDMFSMGKMIEHTTLFMANCNRAIAQNVDATKMPFIAIMKNKDLQLSLETALSQKQDGKPVIIVSEDLGDALKGVKVETEYVADRLLMLRDAERDRLLNRLGIMSANINKRERVQVGEVNATVGQCVDYIYLWIDTFNKQMQTYGLPFSMRLNASLEELYEDAENTDSGAEMPQKEVKENA